MAEEAGGKIYGLIPLVMKSIGVIGKGRKNQAQGYQFRGIDDIYNATQSALIEHGVFVVPQIVECEREDRQTRDGKGTLIYTRMKVSHTFYGPDGSNVVAVTAGEAMDSGDKSSNKAMSAAMKYALIEVFCIPTEGDNDTENHSPEPAPKPQAKPIVVANIKAEMTEVEKFVATLNGAFDAREFQPAERSAVVAATCKAKKVSRITGLNQDDQIAMVAAVALGKFDKYKKPQAA